MNMFLFKDPDTELDPNENENGTGLSFCHGALTKTPIVTPIDDPEGEVQAEDFVADHSTDCFNCYHFATVWLVSRVIVICSIIDDTET